MTSTLHAQIHALDLYERLGIQRTASRDEVRAAYLGLLRQCPPERAPRQFRRIREAYETLNHAASRAEYDRPPTPAVQRLLRQAAAAMSVESYIEAGDHLGRLLAEDPALGYARNWLGLCLIYQQQPEQALRVFEQLLRRADPAPAWFGNAGHACAWLGRLADAESMFQRAVLAAEAGGEDATGYSVALAGMSLARRDLDAAERVLETAIRHDGEVHFEHLQCFTKLLEVQLVRNDAVRVDAVLDRIRAVARDPWQREYLAWKLASFTAELVAAGDFSVAAAVGRAGVALQPDDADGQSVLRVASLLSQKNHAEAEQMLRTHPCFWGEGRFAGLNEAIRGHCSNLRVFGGMKPIKSAPPLFTYNTFGTALYGERDPDAVTRSHVSTLYIVGLFIPLIPLACYRVIPDGDRSWRFLGKVPLSRGNKIHLGSALAAIFLLFLAGALTPAPDGSSYGSGTGYARNGFGTAFPDTTVANAFTASGTPAAPGTAGDRASIEREQFRIRSTETELRRLQDRGDSIGRVIDDVAGQISAMSNRRGGGGDYTRYQDLVRRRDELVHNHNDIQTDLRRRIGEYDVALAALNRRIDRYNAAQ